MLGVAIGDRPGVGNGESNGVGRGELKGVGRGESKGVGRGILVGRCVPGVTKVAQPVSSSESSSNFIINIFIRFFFLIKYSIDQCDRSMDKPQALDYNTFC